ncbi:MAG: hypothetical protein J7M38_07385, partial [Armatimonadetes bacterium]|nr:hypothetical protein [Armatimonadota bacterium]
QYPALIDEYLTKAPAGYSGNRRVLDQALVYGKVAQALAAIHEEDGQAQEAAQSLLDLVTRYPSAPGARAAWPALGRDAAATGDWPTAASCALRVLSYTGDRTRSHRTERRDNQAYLDAIATANDLASVRDCLQMLCGASPAEADVIDAIAERWVNAERASYSVVWNEEWLAEDAAHAETLAGAHYPGAGEQWRPPPTPPLPAWQMVIEACEGTPLVGVAHLALGQWLHYRGMYQSASDHYQAAAESVSRPDAVSPWVSFELGELALHTGHIADALAHFTACSPESDPPLAAEAQLRAAECLECLGRVEEAIAANEQLVASADCPIMVRHRARYALRRLQESGAALSALAGPPGQPALSYVGQDRLTQGDWRTLGHDFFAVLARGGWWDLSGGVRAPLTFRPSVADPERHSYFWHGGGDADPSWLYDPVDNDRGPRNWDDGGEKYATGAGPDLVVHFAVPEGSFRMGLYFVNDRNYYEPNRRYMVHVQDAGSEEVLTAAPMRDFVSGVYWQFDVEGPRELRIRIWRDMSLNTLLTGIFLDDLSALPSWERLTAEALSERHVHAPPAEELAALTPAWERYRDARRSGAPRPVELAPLRAFAGEVAAKLDGYQAGRALDFLAAWLREGGYIEQSCVLQDAALALVSTQGERRHADMLLRVLDAYGARVAYPHQGNVGSFTKSEREAPLYLAYLLPRVAEYIGMTDLPTSLVSPGDLLELARGYYQSKQHWLARPLYEAASCGDIQRLPARDVRNYAWCIDKEERPAVLGALAERDTGGAYDRAFALSQLVFTHVELKQLDEGTEALEKLLTHDVNAGAEFAAYALATALYREGRTDEAIHWAKVILDKFPDTEVADLARKLLQKASAGVH